MKIVIIEEYNRHMEVLIRQINSCRITAFHIGPPNCGKGLHFILLR